MQRRIQKPKSTREKSMERYFAKEFKDERHEHPWASNKIIRKIAGDHTRIKFRLRR